MHLDMQLEEYFHRNKKANGNLLHFYQEQCNQQNEITKSITRNYWQLWNPSQNGDNIYWTPQKYLKSGQIIKISSTFENHINSMEDKQDGI